MNIYKFMAQNCQSFFQSIPSKILSGQPACQMIYCLIALSGSDIASINETNGVEQFSNGSVVLFNPNTFFFKSAINLYIYSSNGWLTSASVVCFVSKQIFSFFFCLSLSLSVSLQHHSFKVRSRLGKQSFFLLQLKWYLAKLSQTANLLLTKWAARQTLMAVFSHSLHSIAEVDSKQL